MEDAVIQALSLALSLALTLFCDIDNFIQQSL